MKYIVVRTGVYDQGIIGVFDTAELASGALKEAKNEENDDYHKFQIRPFCLNKRYQPDTWEGHS